ncbi:DEAD/DEAH box helicase [Bizionia sediminis]|uniref:DEAD/DEAH box helicase n=1 Tax=Bizionia sediminis TaxID=1737064 RepID=A0ABW5KR53_9FLAO
MSFKKLHPLLKEALVAQDMHAAMPLQKTLLPKLKSGINMYVVAKSGTGKTTALVLATVHKLQAQAKGDSPRALIMVKDKESGLALKQTFERFTANTDLRIYCVHDTSSIEKQKDDIYVGTDIIIATPKRLNKLYFINGIHLGELQILALDDAHLILQANFQNDVLRVSDSLKKCQYLIFTEVLSAKLKSLEHSMMHHAELVVG